jgi:hypothetical protein
MRTDEIVDFPWFRHLVLAAHRGGMVYFIWDVDGSLPCVSTQGLGSQIH